MMGTGFSVNVTGTMAKGNFTAEESNQVIPDHGNRQKRWTLFNSYLLKFERVRYQISYQAFEISC